MTIYLTPRACQQCQDRRAIPDRSGRLHCMNCNATRGRVSGRTTAFVEAIIKRYGRLDAPVTLRHQQKEDGAG
jgi:hypothetical protein